MVSEGGGVIVNDIMTISVLATWRDTIIDLGARVLEFWSAASVFRWPGRRWNTPLHAICGE